MKLHRYFLITVILILGFNAAAQELHFQDSIKAYNQARIYTNMKGMYALEIWGLANVGFGATGYFEAKNDQWKYFHGMNAAWGAVNAGIATYGFHRARMQAKEPLNMKKAYYNYRSDRRVFQINILLDAAYMAGGAALMSYSKNDHNNPQMLQGYGASIVIQGFFLLAFDNIMFYSHEKYNSRWNQIVNEMAFTGNGISMRLK